MAVTIECPECGAMLRPAKPVAAGKKLRCPKCEQTFAVPGDEVESEVEERPSTAVKKKSAAPPKPSVPKKPAPAPAPKGVDDEDAGAYGLLDTPEKEQEEADAKPEIEYSLDTSIKDPRGPATAALAGPSTWILVIGAVMVVGGLLAVGFFFWPFMFTPNGTAVKPVEARIKYEKKKHEEALKDWLKKPEPRGNQPKKHRVLNPDEAPDDVKYEELNSKPERDKGMKISEKEMYDDMKDEDVEFRTTWGIVCVVILLYGGFMAGVAVQMTTLESYKWSMTAAILAMVTLIALPFGMWALTLLKKPEIKEAFEFKPVD